MMQKLIKQCYWVTATTSGCRVGLKDEEGRLLRKGWRVITSHARLGQILQQPCSPKAWHETEDWTGQRWVLTAYVARGHQCPRRRSSGRAQGKGVPCPPKPPETPRNPEKPKPKTLQTPPGAPTSACGSQAGHCPSFRALLGV